MPSKANRLVLKFIKINESVPIATQHIADFKLLC